MKLLDRVRQVLRTRHYAYRTDQCYCEWIVKFIRFHGLRYLNKTGAAEVEQYLTHLVVAEHVSSSA